VALLRREQACLTHIPELARMLTSTQGSNWYLLQCKPRQDERAQINLLRQNYVIFCPQIISERLIHRQTPSIARTSLPGVSFHSAEP